MPLSVHLLVTERCNALCTTCAQPLRATRELDTNELIRLVDELAACGTVRVGIGGGEPLVRDDIGALVDRCTAHGMWTTLETNGYLYPERAEELRALGRLVIALDGPEEVHDANHEPGSWRKAVAAVRVARARGLDVHIVATVTRANVERLDEVLDLADELDVTADFQLLQGRPWLSPARLAELAPADSAVRKAFRGLLEARLAGRRVGSTEKFLRYMLTWEDLSVPTSTVPHEDVHCLAGQLYCAVQPDGRVSPCSMSPALPGGVREHGFGAAFDALRDNPCRACTSTALTEYNYLYNLNAPTLLEWVKTLRPQGGPEKGATRRGGE
jgi:MoaA/NifB/PqqE/SkfB family radical SAM enzyme